MLAKKACLIGSALIHPNSFVLALCTGHVGTIPKLFPQMSWYADALRVSFTGSKVIPPPPNFTIGTMQSDQYRSPGNH